jgi:thiamine biosynthesis protein ThiS
MKSLEATIVVNGQSRAVELPCTVAQLLEQGGLKTTQAVVEYNGSVLPKSCLEERLLVEGDRLEVIVPVAGG